MKALNGAINRLQEQLTQAKARELDLIVTIGRLWEGVKRLECTEDLLPDLTYSD
jgi:hypothetical protein